MSPRRSRARKAPGASRVPFERGRFLAALDGSPYSQSALAYAADLARLFKADLDAVYVEDSRLLDAYRLGDWAGAAGAGPSTALADGVEKLIHAQGRAVLALAAREAKRRRLGLRPMVKKGAVSEVLLSASRLAGLVAMGIRGAGGGREGVLGPHLAAVLHRCKRPVLAAPEKYRKATGVVAAYDGSAYSRRALELGAAVAQAARQSFTVLHISENVLEGEMLLDEAKAFLGEAPKRHFVLDRGRPRQALSRLAADAEGEFLLVMGAYGHTHLRELALGSTTNYVLQSTRVPVLLVR